MISQPRVGEIMLHGERRQSGDAESGDDRQEDLQRRLLSRHEPERADDQTEHRRGEDVTERRVQDQGDTDRQDRIADDAEPRPVTRLELANLVEPRQAGRRFHARVLGLVGQPVEHRDLIEPHCGHGRRQLERRRLAAAERDQERGRERRDTSALHTVRRRDTREAFLDHVHRLADRIERGTEADDEQLKLLQRLGGQWKIATIPMPASAVVTHATCSGNWNEWSMTRFPSVVVPVVSASAAAIWVPFAGRKSTPATAVHIAIMYPAPIPNAKPSGTIVRVAADWLVVSAATAKIATAIMNGHLEARSPSAPTIASSLLAMNVSAIHAIPKSAIIATMPEVKIDIRGMSAAFTFAKININAAAVSITIWMIGVTESGSSAPSSPVTVGRIPSKSPKRQITRTAPRKIATLRFA